MTIRVTWKRVLLTLCALVVAGMLFAWSGAMKVSASSGHWRITDWFLHWVMRNSVRTYAAVQTPEDVTDDRGLISAAGHFRQACQVCHGAPGIRPSPVMQASTPPAPDLAETAGEWTDPQLFWIIRHGVKFTAMPAWPAEGRDDEVRRMVSFVRLLPDMSPARYRSLAEQVESSSLPQVRAGVLASCTGCHGTDGRGRGQDDIPILGGQKAAYLATAMQEYASGKRQSAVMAVASATLSPVEIAVLAKHFAKMPGLERTGAQSHPLISKGDATRQLPACQKCHQENGKAPVLAGQKATYINARLDHWRGERTEVEARKPPDTMPVIARRIQEDEIEALAKAYERQSTRQKAALE